MPGTGNVNKTQDWGTPRQALLMLLFFSFYSFISFIVIETGSYSVALAVLELTMLARMASNSQRSACFCL